ncbi:MAG: hypothetical protein RSB52_08045 [Acidaminococcaceae bacterium]
MEKILLEKELIVNGNPVTEVALDFDKVTGKELVAAEKEVREMGDTTPSVFLSMKYQAIVAAQMIGVKKEDILALPAKDFRNVVTPVAIFFLG